MKLSPWIVLDHCATRVIEGSNPAISKNRIAFIEKTPRVRLLAESYAWEFTSEPSICGEAAQDAWIAGPKGDGDLCGADPASRKWCDDMLTLLGYELT